MLPPKVSSASKFLQGKVQELLSLYHASEFELVVSKIKPLKGLFPQSAILLNLEGASYASLERYEAAIDSYKQAIKIKPDYDEAFNNMGNALKGKGEREGAISSYKKAIKVNSECVDAYYNLSISQNEIGEFKEARKNAECFIELKPNSAEAYYLSGFYLCGENLESAIENCNKALKMRPDYILAHDVMTNCMRHYIWVLNNKFISNIEQVDELIKAEQEKLQIKIRRCSLWFVDIPRTSSTAIRLLLGEKLGWPYGKNNLNRESRDTAKITSSMLLPDHTPAFIAKRFIGNEIWKEIDTFTVVRHPCSWCSSLWHYARKYFDLGLKVDSFDQFLGSLEEKLEGDFTKRRTYPSSYRQTDYILDAKGQVMIKYLLRIEDNESITNFLKLRGISDYSKTPRSVETRSADYKFTNSEKKKIERIFEKDFEILGY